MDSMPLPKFYISSNGNSSTGRFKSLCHIHGNSYVSPTADVIFAQEFQNNLFNAARKHAVIDKGKY